MRSKYNYMTFAVINASKYSARKLNAVVDEGTYKVTTLQGYLGSVLEPSIETKVFAFYVIDESTFECSYYYKPFSKFRVPFKVPFNSEAYIALDRKKPIGLMRGREEMFC